MQWLIVAILILAQQPAKAPEGKGTAQPKVAIDTGQTKKADQSGSPSQPSVSVTVNNALPSPNGDSNKEQTEENMRIQGRLTLYTGLLVCAAFITAGLIWWQAKKTAEATRAMRDSLPLQKATADAALKNAQAVIDSERAYLLTERVEMPPSFSWGTTQKTASAIHNLRNYGKTPAFVLAERSELQYGTIDDFRENRVPDPTVFNLDGSGFQRFYPVPAGGDCPSNTRLRVEPPPDATIPWICGLIRYRDMFQQDINRETWYCYAYDPQSGNFRPGPREYNRIT